MSIPEKAIVASFFRQLSGREPVREWLLELSKEDRRTIGDDIATLEFCWPIGKPKCAPLKGTDGLFEVRSNISSGRIARILFCLRKSRMVLLHGFIKKSQKTLEKDLQLAAKRQRELNSYD